MQLLCYIDAKYHVVITRKLNLFLRKSIKLLPPELLLLAQICTKSFVGWGFAQDPTGGAYSAPPDPLAGLRGPTSKGRGGKGRGGEGGDSVPGKFWLGIYPCSQYPSLLHCFTPGSNLPFQQILAILTLLLYPLDCLHDHGTGPDLSRSSVYFLVFFSFTFLFIPCGRLTWLSVSFFTAR